MSNIAKTTKTGNDEIASKMHKIGKAGKNKNRKGWIFKNLQNSALQKQLKREMMKQLTKCTKQAKREKTENLATLHFWLS